jgi:hypothetical protein
MKRIIACLVSAFVLLASPVHGDFAGPIPATRALSPDGNLLVRITPNDAKGDLENLYVYNVTYYAYAAASDSYVKRSSFRLQGYLSEMLYVSNSGDLVLIALDPKEAIRLYSPEGKPVKTWDLSDFLTKKEIKACAQTGSTLQWLDEASFSDRTLTFRGPSHVIRALQASYTVMRGANPRVSFSGTLDATTGDLHKDEPEE